MDILVVFMVRFWVRITGIPCLPVCRLPFPAVLFRVRFVVGKKRNVFKIPASGHISWIREICETSCIAV